MYIAVRGDPEIARIDPAAGLLRLAISTDGSNLPVVMSGDHV
jgi:hypothetical protein